MTGSFLISAPLYTLRIACEDSWFLAKRRTRRGGDHRTQSKVVANCEDIAAGRLILKENLIYELSTISNTTSDDRRLLAICQMSKLDSANRGCYHQAGFVAAV
jgi:hypothetical protein